MHHNSYDKKKKTPAGWRGFSREQKLLLDVDDNTGTNGTAALADSEAQALLDGDGGDQLLKKGV